MLGSLLLLWILLMLLLVFLWNYQVNKMVRQFEGHKFTPMSNKFNMMADKLKAAKVAAENEGNLDETGQDEVSR